MADMFSLAGSLVSGGMGLIGSKMQADATNKAARLNQIYEAGQNQIERDWRREVWDTQNSIDAYRFQTQLNNADLDRQLQREFATNGIQWRALDARKAGIHPLAALGAQLHSSSPIAISGGSAASPPSVSLSHTPGHAGASMGAGLSSFGQDLGRAIAAAAPEASRAAEVASTQSALQLQNMKLQNELLASQIAKTTGAAVGPAMPTATQKKFIDGQGNTVTKGGLTKNALVNEKKHEPVVGHPNQKQSEPGEVADVGYARTKDGWTPVPSKDVKERIEDSFLAETLWEIRNRVPQTFGFKMSPPPHVKVPSGQKWQYNPFAQEYQLYTPSKPSAPGAHSVKNRNWLRTN